MNKLFDLNNPFFSFLSKVADVIILSFLWFVSCLPIITIGPATSALYYVTLKLARKEDVQITSCFFKGFKSNLLQGMAHTLIFGVLLVVLVYDYMIAAAMSGTASALCSGIFFALGIWVLCAMFYTFPLQAQFYNTVKQTIVNATILAIRKFPTTVAIFAVNIVPAMIILCANIVVIFQLAPLMVLVYPGFAALVCSWMLVKIFDPLIEVATGKKPGVVEVDNEEE